MTLSDRLKELRERASPGPWAVRHGPYHLWGGDGSWSPILYASPEIDQGDGSTLPGQEDRRKATAEFAGLATHLPDAVEALGRCAAKLEAQDIREGLPASAELDNARAVLKEIGEAVDASGH